MTHWYRRHQSAALVQRASYYFSSFSLFISIDGTSRELSTHMGTLSVITTFMQEWLTEWDDTRMDGLQSLYDWNWHIQLLVALSLIISHMWTVDCHNKSNKNGRYISGFCWLWRVFYGFVFPFIFFHVLFDPAPFFFFWNDKRNRQDFFHELWWKCNKTNKQSLHL